MKTLSCLIILFILAMPKAQAEPNMVLCWIFSMQGCPGVDPVGGKARGLSTSGGGGVGAIGGKTSRVEKRTIIKVPDYKIRRFLRALGLGGNIINISYETKGGDCNEIGGSLQPSSNALFESNNARECMNALQQDLVEAPRGINLQVLQCKERFCNEDFIEVFDSFLKDHPEFKISNSEKFLGCGSGSIEI
jgi:hypothetical protein